MRKSLNKPEQYIIKELIRMQDELNTMIDYNWKELRTNKQLSIAIFTEVAELIESLPWKWWKNTTINYQNIKTEIIDIWHFVLSILTRNSDDYTLVISALNRVNYEVKDIKEDYYIIVDTTIKLLNEIKKLDKESLFNGFTFYRINIYTNILNLLLELTAYFGLDLVNDIYVNYIVKHTLNKFRLHNGYKTGTYQKVINGKEDNEIIFELAKKIIESEVNLFEVPDILYKTFERYYNEQLNKNN